MPTYLRILAEVPGLAKLLSVILISMIGVELIWGASRLFWYDGAQVATHAELKQPILDATDALIIPLFGKSDEVVDAPVVLSPLNLTLVGILYSPLQANCTAILQMPNKEERVFHVGDTIADGALLDEIRREEILIVRQGRVERLSLPESGLSFDPPAQPLIR